MIDIKLPDVCKKALAILNEKGFEAYAVGGCVRDLILKKIPSDFDITTSATPNEIEAAFSDYITLPLGKSHGTITVYIDGQLFEITTFRIDGEYFDNRHPDNVSFCATLSEDLARRDFTINAIAYHPAYGIIDIFDGIADLQNKIIRTVGDGYKRFCEDALRIMRAFRFAAQLDFRLTHDTYNDIMLSADMLKNISRERITMEFSKILMCKNPERVLNLMCELDVIQQFIPEFRAVRGFDEHRPQQMETLDKHIFSAISIAEESLILRLALLFHDIAKPQCQVFDEFHEGHFYDFATTSANISRTRMENMRFEKKLTEAVFLLIKYSQTEIEMTRASVKRWLNRLSFEGFLMLLKLRMADLLATNQVRCEKELAALKWLYDQAIDIVESKECYTLKTLKINGSVLQKLGVKKGEAVGAMLNQLLLQVMKEPQKNTNATLIRLAKEALM